MLLLVLGAVASGAPTLSDVVGLHRRADGIVRDPQQLATAYDALCTQGNALACKWRAWDDFGRAKDVDLARVADPACANGNTEACLLVAWASPGPTVEDRLRQLEPPCKAGVQRACTDLGVELTQDPLARQAERDRALSLHHVACDAGVAIACRRAAEAGDAAARAKAVALGDPVFLPAREACDQGAVAGCTALLATAEGADRIALLERLCRMDDTHCAALAVARRGDPGQVQTGRITRATWTDGAVLLGWDANGPWTPHARVAIADLTHATLRATNPGREHLELVVGPTLLSLPEGCDGVVAGVAALAAAGRPARAVTADGNPTHSVCVDALGAGRGPRYRSGKLTVTSSTDSSAGSIVVRDALATRTDALYDCADADTPDDPRATWKGSFMAGRDGTVGKVKTEESSGSAVLDSCFATWIAGTDLGRRAEPLGFVVTVEIPY